MREERKPPGIPNDDRMGGLRELGTASTRAARGGRGHLLLRETRAAPADTAVLPLHGASPGQKEGKAGTEASGRREEGRLDTREQEEGRS